MNVYIIHYEEENFWGTGVENYGVKAVLANKEQAEKFTEKLNKKYSSMNFWIEEFKVQGL